jgi:hypothetical protein
MQVAQALNVLRSIGGVVHITITPAERVRASVAGIRGFVYAFDAFKHNPNNLFEKPCRPMEVLVRSMFRRQDKPTLQLFKQTPLTINFAVLETLQSVEEVFAHLQIYHPKLTELWTFLRQKVDQMSEGEVLRLCNISPIELIDRYFRQNRQPYVLYADGDKTNIIARLDIESPLRPLVHLSVDDSGRLSIADNDQAPSAKKSRTIPRVVSARMPSTTSTTSTATTATTRATRTVTTGRTLRIDDGDAKSSSSSSSSAFTKVESLEEMMDRCLIHNDTEFNGKGHAIPEGCQKVAPTNVSNSCYINAMLFSLCHLASPNPIVEFLVGRKLFPELTADERKSEEFKNANNVCDKESQDTKLHFFRFILIVYQHLINRQPVELVDLETEMRGTLASLGVPEFALSNMNLCLCYFRRFLAGCRHSDKNWERSMADPEMVFEVFRKAFSLGTQFVVEASEGDTTGDEAMRELRRNAELQFLRKALPEKAALINADTVMEYRQRVIEILPNLDEFQKYVARLDPRDFADDKMVYTTLEDEYAINGKVFPFASLTPSQKMFVRSRRVLGNVLVQDEYDKMLSAMPSPFRYLYTEVDAMRPPFYVQKVPHSKPGVLKVGMEEPIEIRRNGYELVSAIHHSGLHYICFFRCENAWYVMNDLQKLDKNARAIPSITYVCPADDEKAIREAFGTYVTTLVYVKVDQDDEDDEDELEIIDVDGDVEE